MSSDPVHTAHEVADELGIHYQTLRKHMLSGRMQAVKRGNRWFIRRSWVEAFLAPAPADNVA